jgi:hypothetical protein
VQNKIIIKIPDDLFFQPRCDFLKRQGFYVEKFSHRDTHGIILLKETPNIFMGKIIDSMRDNIIINTNEADVADKKVIYLFIHTGVFCGRRYIGRLFNGMDRHEEYENRKKIIDMLSGRRHQLITAFKFFSACNKVEGKEKSSASFDGADMKLICKTVFAKTTVKMKSFSMHESEAISRSESIYPVESPVETLISSVIGSYGNLRGVPALELANHLDQVVRKVKSCEY